ncbi:MAG: preprotein translocase subunit YajC [Anaerolineae bacterium]
MEIVLLALVMLLGLGAYWTMVVFPKQRDFTKRQKYVQSLAAGDEVVTYGGIIGRVMEIDADKGIAYVEVSEGIVLRMVTAAVVQSYDAAKFSLGDRVDAEGKPDHG